MEFASYKKHKKQIKNLFKSAFPRAERWPLRFLYRKAQNEDYDFWAILENGEFVGLTYTMKSENFIYIFYLAVCEKKRGQGFGSKIINEIKNQNPGETITLCIEDMDIKDAPNYNQRLRRLKFYESNGFIRLNFKIHEAGVDFELLGTDKTVSFREFMALMKRFLGERLYKRTYKNLKERQKYFTI